MRHRSISWISWNPLRRQLDWRLPRGCASRCRGLARWVTRTLPCSRPPAPPAARLQHCRRRRLRQHL